ncbi:MAG: DNA mismatch repair protein MutS [Defluviitaleaceae bacterium]|nr:DNA mismatch repair protein MutS [Defluviitaleaceae bacterium]
MKIKDENPYCLIFFRLGDFYELFFDDAIIASRELDIVLTGRDCGMEERAPMCGVPHHAADGYIARLIEKGHRVAVVEQTEEAIKGAKTPVKRDVVRIVTPGTVQDTNILDGGKNNFLMAVYKDTRANRFGLAAADVTTGEFFAYSIASDNNLLKDEITRISPAEILAQDALYGKIKKITASPVSLRGDKTFDYISSHEVLCSHLNLTSLDGLGFANDQAAVSAAGCIFYYLKETQRTALLHIVSLKKYINSEFCEIDAASRRNLELTENIRERKKSGSLLWVLDKTKTAMGARTLRRWITEPLTSTAKIDARLNAVDELFSNNLIRTEIRENLSKIADTERIVGRINFNTATPRELLALKQSLDVLPQILKSLHNFQSTFLSHFRDESDHCADVAAFIGNAISPDAPTLISAGGYILTGYNAELDALRSDKDNGAGLILSMEADEREKTGIRNLKIRYNKVFGYNIEITNSYKNDVPERYRRLQTLANCERYSTVELKELEERVLSAEDKVNALESKLWIELNDALKSNIRRILNAGHTIAVIDCLQSLAEVAEQNRYVRPRINTTGEIAIQNGRHPVVERLVDNFIPNNVVLNTVNERLVTLTGPNMAGKSTYMRMAAQIIIMAQMGCFVPADYADIGIVDKLFTRVGAADDLASGQSTFMVEMNEVANILNNATANSFIILDEIGRGTSTYDGMSIAWATLEYLAVVYKARTIFATHYHELTELEGKVSGVVNYNVAVKEQDDGIIFLHKIMRGGADRSYGIHVARLAGLPDSVVSRAADIMEKLAAKDEESIGLEEESPKVIYPKNRRKGHAGNRLILEEDIEGAIQLSIRDVFKNLE